MSRRVYDPNLTKTVKQVGGQALHLLSLPGLPRPEGSARPKSLMFQF